MTTPDDEHIFTPDDVDPQVWHPTPGWEQEAGDDGAQDDGEDVEPDDPDRDTR